MNIIGNGRPYENGQPIAEYDEHELEARIVPGRGKLEGVSFGSDPRIETTVRDILIGIGEQPDREGLLKTPSRVAKMYAELTAGYHIDPAALINDAIFSVSYDEMVLVKHIDFSSLCEHHRRLQVQERMTVQIADFIDKHLDPAGVAVVAEGVHLCAVMRGVKKANARMVTSAMRGIFRDDPKARQEFMAHVGRSQAYGG